MATDDDATNNSIAYSLDDDAAGRFSINAATGEITVSGLLDHETDPSHNIIVRASSSDGSSSTCAFTITVTDVSEFSATLIVDNDGAANWVAENASIGTAVGITAHSDDADTSDTITYSLDDSDGGRFAIDAATGVVSVAGTIDREVDGATRFLTIRATSTDGSFQTRSFAITIDDVDEFDVGVVIDNDLTPMPCTRTRLAACWWALRHLRPTQMLLPTTSLTLWMITQVGDSPSTERPEWSAWPMEHCSIERSQPAITSQSGPLPATES